MADEILILKSKWLSSRWLFGDYWRHWLWLYGNDFEHHFCDSLLFLVRQSVHRSQMEVRNGRSVVWEWIEQFDSNSSIQIANDRMLTGLYRSRTSDYQNSWLSNSDYHPVLYESTMTQAKTQMITQTNDDSNEPFSRSFQCSRERVSINLFAILSQFLSQLFANR